jgi:hypothetical protein
MKRQRRPANPRSPSKKSGSPMEGPKIAALESCSAEGKTKVVVVVVLGLALGLRAGLESCLTPKFRFVCSRRAARRRRPDHRATPPRPRISAGRRMRRAASPRLAPSDNARATIADHPRPRRRRRPRLPPRPRTRPRPRPRVRARSAISSTFPACCPTRRRPRKTCPSSSLHS